MANRNIANSPARNENFNSQLTPAVMRRLEGDGRARRPQIPVEAESATTGEFAAVKATSVSSLATAVMIFAGLAAVEGARIGLVHDALGGLIGGGGQSLPFASLLTVGLTALDAGLLVRMFAPSTVWRGMAAWASTGAWLLATTANSILAMYAVAAMMDGANQLAEYAPAGVAIVLLLLRVLLMGALAWDANSVFGRR